MGNGERGGKSCTACVLMVVLATDQMHKMNHQVTRSRGERGERPGGLRLAAEKR